MHILKLSIFLLFCSACSVNHISSNDVKTGNPPIPADLQINNFIGFIETVPAPSDKIEVNVKPNSPLITNVNSSANNIVIEGALKSGTQISCNNNNGIRSYKIAGHNYSQEQLPHIQIALPENKSIGIWKSSPFVKFGNIRSADFELVGCGKIDVASIKEDAKISIDGSNEINIGTISDVLFLDINGAGDAKIAKILQLAKININGSGNIFIDEQASEINYLVNGSGNLNVKKGGGALFANIRGSGGVSHGGFVTNPEIYINGSGDVNVHEIRGAPKISISGSGRFNVK